MSDEIFVKSHVARDLLQSAGLFKNDRLVVWEYVVNGLQYITPGTKAEVRVTLDSREKRISIADNGRGMNWQGLQNFFVMHGENLDRKQSRGVDFSVRASPLRLASPNCFASRRSAMASVPKLNCAARTF